MLLGAPVESIIDRMQLLRLRLKLMNSRLLMEMEMEICPTSRSDWVSVSVSVSVYICKLQHALNNSWEPRSGSLEWNGGGRGANTLRGTRGRRQWPPHSASIFSPLSPAQRTVPVPVPHQAPSTSPPLRTTTQHNTIHPDSSSTIELQSILIVQYFFFSFPLRRNRIQSTAEVEVDDSLGPGLRAISCAEMARSMSI